MNDTSSLHDAHGAHASQRTPRYASFWRRLFASSIDGLVLMPAAVMGWWALSSRTAAVLLLVPSSACWHLYRVIMHAHRGQTIGKVAARIAVVTTSGLPISWREALLRDSVSIALTALATASMLLAATLIPEAAWNHGWRETASLLDGAEPTWGHWAKAASAFWLGSDLLMLLVNRQRRSLHDIVAGTVVIRIPRDAGRAPPSDI